MGQSDDLEFVELLRQLGVYQAQRVDHDRQRNYTYNLCRGRIWKLRHEGGGELTGFRDRP